MTEETRQVLDRRLARIEGQVRGLRRMVQEGSYCCDTLTQLAAARSALDQVGAEIVALHVQNCIVGHGRGSEHDEAKPMSQSELIEELRVVLSRLVR